MKMRRPSTTKSVHSSGGSSVLWLRSSTSKLTVVVRVMFPTFAKERWRRVAQEVVIAPWSARRLVVHRLSPSVRL
jgi:hypothetical protein